MNGLVDTGSTRNTISRAALSKIAINRNEIQEIDHAIYFGAFNNVEYLLREYVTISWGHARYAGSDARTDQFFIVNSLPQSLEIVMGGPYATELIMELTRERSRSRRRRTQESEYDYT